MKQIPRDRGRSRLLIPLVGLAVFAVVLAAFRPALQNGFVDWDDPANLLDNPNYRGLGFQQLAWMFTTFHMGHYQPLSWMTLGLDFLWGRAVFGNGLDARAYHLTNLLLHAANAVLAFLVARRLLAFAFTPAGQPAPWPDGTALRANRGAHGAARAGNNAMGLKQRAASPDLVFAPGTDAGEGWIIWPAALAALWFGLHPLRVESTAWATERRDVLSCFFLLMTLACYLRAYQPGREHRSRWVVVALVSFAASLLSRAMGVTLPIILLLLDWYPLRRLGWRDRHPSGVNGIAWRGVLLEKLPFLLLATGAAIVAPIAQRSAGATFSLVNHGAVARLAQACYGLVFYLRKMVLPTSLSPIYEIHTPLDLASPRYAIPIAIVFLGLLACVILVIRARQPAIVVAAACYVVLLLPVLGFVQSGNQEVADRYSYLPSLAVSVPVAGALAWAWRRSQNRRWPKGLLAGLGGATVVTLAVLTWRQCGIWRDTTTLWTHAVGASPDSSVAQNGYGWVLLQNQHPKEALIHLRRAMELQPNNSMAHRNIWIALRQLGRTDELIQAYRDSIKILPTFAEAHYNLGVVLGERADLDAAEACYRQAIAHNPGYSQAHTNLAIILVKRGETAEAFQHFEQAIKSDDRNIFAHCGFARLLRRLGRTREAVDEVRAALRIDPSYVPAQKLQAELGTGSEP